MRRIGIFLASAVVLTSTVAMCQESRSEIGLEGTGFFTKSASNATTDYSATESAGVLGTYRYHLNHWLSVEGAYGYSANTQKYILSGTGFIIQSGIHQFTGSLVLNLPSHPRSKMAPYVLAGGGALLLQPTGNALSLAQGQTKGVFVYGAGLNYAVHKGIAIRAEYRGLVYTSPDFGYNALATNSITHTAEPSVGLAFRF